MNKAAMTYIEKADTGYPAGLIKYLGDDVPDRIAAFGDTGILQKEMVAVFCSVKCPGDFILQTYDAVGRLREAGVAVIGGFHSPMEQECLTMLLRGRHPVVVCPARSIENMRVRKEFKKPLEEGRLLFLSPFDEKEKRMTEETALFRNRFVAALADKVFVAYAEPGGKTERFCGELAAWGKTLYNLKSISPAPISMKVMLGA